MQLPFAFVYLLLVSVLLGFISFFLVKNIFTFQKTEQTLRLLEENVYFKNYSFRESYNLANLYLKKKLYKKALRIFWTILQYISPEDKIAVAGLSNTIGFLYFQLGNYEPAIFFYERAVKMNPSYILALNNLGLTYEKLCNYPKAAKCYQTSLAYAYNEKISNRLKTLKREL